MPLNKETQTHISQSFSPSDTVYCHNQGTSSLTDKTSPNQGGPGSDNNEVVLHILLNCRIGAWPSDSLVIFKSLVAGGA